MINLIAGFFALSFCMHFYSASFSILISMIIQKKRSFNCPSLIFEEKIEPKPKKSLSKNVKTTSSSFSEDAKSKNDFESDVNSFFLILKKIEMS